ncbi:MAG TPA: putative hydro-lyase [Candidatus Methylomirabilis sp.]|nr:putative hydro-lyase [Candidatus Methylomirabilis sp.]
MVHPQELRRQIRDGKWRKPTAGLAPGYVQTNLVVLPRDLAYDFLVFAQRNPKPCPIIEVTDVGSPEPRLSAPGADLRTDVPLYRIYRDGGLAGEVTDLLGVWTQDLVAFLLGCSFTFETALLQAGVPVRHIEEGKNVSMFISTVPCLPAGVFHGPLVVTMRPIPAPLVARAVQISGRYPGVHGAPVHIGDPAAIGIRDLGRPDFGDPVTIRPGEIPVFWACGVTPQAVAMQVKPPLMITHAPGHMFITDLRDASLAVF